MRRRVLCIVVDVGADFGFGVGATRTCSLPPRVSVLAIDASSTWKLR